MVWISRALSTSTHNDLALNPANIQLRNTPEVQVNGARSTLTNVDR